MYCSMKKDMGPDDGLWLWLKTIGETNNIQLAKSVCTSNWFFKTFNSLFQKYPFFQYIIKQTLTNGVFPNLLTT